MERLARFILNRRYYILGVIGLVTLFLGAFSLQVKLNERPDELLYRDDPEYPNLKAFFKDFGYDEIVVAVYSAENVLEKRHLEAIRKITDELRRIDGITRVASIGNADDVAVRDGSIEIGPLLAHLPETAEEREALKNRIAENPLYRDLLVTKDGRNALFDITLDAELSAAKRDIVLREIDSAFARGSNGNRYYMAGSPMGRSEGFRLMRRDFSTLLPIGMVLLVASMYFVFRNYLCVVLPFVAVSLSVVWTIGVMYLTGSELNFFSVLIPTVLFIIGTSDCIHILSHYQDCRHVCRTKAEAVFETVRLMMLPCLLTCGTIMVGFLSVAVCRIPVIQTFGIFSAVGMGFATLLTLTILPIGVIMADTKMLSMQRPLSDSLLGILERLAQFTHTKRSPILVFSLAVLGLGIWGTTRLKLETDPGKFFSEKTRLILDSNYIEKEVGGGIPFFVVVESPEEDRVKDPALLEKIDRLSEFLRGQDGVDQVVSGADLIKYMSYRLGDNDPSEYRIPGKKNAVAELLLTASLSDQDGLLSRFFDPVFSKTPVAIRFRYHDFYSYKRLMDAVLPYLEAEFDGIPGVRTYVTGTNMMLARTMIPILSGLNQSLWLAGIDIFLVMIFLFRSIRLGLVSMIPNVIPIFMTLGIMGLFGIPLNFGTAPIAAIALGLAVDDTIHFMTCFKHEFASDRNYQKAIERALRSCGKPILITTVILSAGFLIFLLSNFQYTRSMGMLISLTLSTAVFGDLFLLPAMLLVFKPLGKGTDGQEDEIGSCERNLAAPL
ncbi:MAG: MMPL family transporter [bacterium]